MKIPLARPDIGDAEIAAVTAVLRSSHLSLGPKLEEFEAAMAAHTGVEHAIGVSSGTAGLHLALLALGIGAGDEVLVPSFTFVAVANAVRYVGASPVFIDIEAHTLNMDPACVSAAITSRTRAMVLVHTFGVPARVTELMDLAHRYGLKVIEDACEALGSSYEGRPMGSFGDVGVFAFYPNKQITTGEGGMIVTPHASLARTMRALRNQGRYPSDDWLQHSILGYNYRLSEMQCALGCVQLQRLPELLAKRAAVAQLYSERLAGVPSLRLPPLPEVHVRIGWFVYVVQLVECTAAERDAVLEHMQASGIQCGRYFAPIHQQPAYDAWSYGVRLPVTESISQTTLALPFFSEMRSDEVEYVCAHLLRSVRELCPGKQL